jgi:ribosomal protein L22
MSPLNWLQEKLAPRTRAAPVTEVEVAKQENPNLFQAAAAQPTAPTPSETQEGTPQPSKKSVVKAKKTHTEVGFMIHAKQSYLKYKYLLEQHKYSTPNFKISHRKLNDLGRQISGKPIDYAIMQMHFSEKRASKRIENMLMTAKSHAVKLKGLPGPKLVIGQLISQALVFLHPY